MKPAGLLLGLALALCGCAQLGHEPGTAPVPPVAGLPLEWWRGFDDPALERLVELALRDNLDLAAAAERIREQRALRRQAAGARAPLLSLSGQHETGRSARDGHDETYFYGLDLSWEVDLFGRLRALEQAGAAELQASTADYQALRVSLLGEVIGAYLNYRLAQREVGIATQAADAQAEIARITRVRFDQGTASGLDVERFDAQVALTRAAVPQARERAETARYALAYLLDAEPARIDALLSGDSAPRPPRQSDLQALLDLPAERLQGRPDVQAAQWRWLAAEREQEAAQALRYPQLTLGALIGLEQGSSLPAWSLGAQALAPLVDFGRIRAGIEASDARREQARLAYRAALNQALRETRSAIAAYGQGLETGEWLDRARQSADNATELARRQYAAGTVSLIEVLDAERTQFDTQLEQVRADTEVALRWVAIYRTLGLAPAASEPASTPPSSDPAGHLLPAGEGKSADGAGAYGEHL